ELFRRSTKDMITDPFYFFEFLKDFFYISDRYTTLEAYRIMVMRYEILRLRWQYLTGEGIRIAEDVSLETMAQIAEQTHHLQGVMTRTKMVRIYTDVYDIGHVLGYIGPVTAEDIGRDPSYSSLDQIGKSGVEAFAENHLRGIRGSIEVETDPTGRIITEIGGEKAVNGKDIYLTIDIELQRTAMESLRNNIERIAAMKQDERHFGDANAGSVVVLDVRTGEVLAMASYPSYDPNWFVLADEQSMENRMKALTDSATTPMFNRAIQALYTPGSTYKPIVAVAGLESGAITEHSTIACTGHEVIGEWDFYCLTYRRYGWVHGDLTIQRAIETSCNLYFYKLGVETGIDELDYWARHFGLGEPTGIDLYGEQKGIRSSREYKYATFADRWYIADTAQSAIGQMYNNFTPLQMANYTASISNGGKRFTPFVLKEVRNQAGEMVLETQPNYQQVPWEADTFRILKASMRGVVLDGTAQRIFEDFPVMVAGKTGTAETGRESGESSNALFIAYAPYEEPEIAVAVVIEKGVWGSYTAYVAKDIFSAYFNIQPEEDKTDE
ncbi:MAG: penicillin-binding protein 2, partial [Clostridia bacterium]